MIERLPFNHNAEYTIQACGLSPDDLPRSSEDFIKCLENMDKDPKALRVVSLCVHGLFEAVAPTDPFLHLFYLLLKSSGVIKKPSDFVKAIEDGLVSIINTADMLSSLDKFKQAMSSIFVMGMVAVGFADALKEAKNREEDQGKVFH